MIGNILKGLHVQHTCLKFCLLGLLKAFGHLFNCGDSKCTWQRSAAAVKI